MGKKIVLTHGRSVRLCTFWAMVLVYVVGLVDFNVHAAVINVFVVNIDHMLAK